MRYKIFGGLIVIFAFLSVIYTPLESRFVMHFGEIDFKLSLLDLTVSLTKKQHILGFGIFTILIMNYLINVKGRYIKTFLSVFGFSILIELIQIFFVEGHFKLRDLFSNIIGIVFALCIFRVSENYLKKATGLKIALISILMIVVQLLLTYACYFIFKEISVMLGGEGIRRFL